MRRLDIYQSYGNENLEVGPQSTVSQTFVSAHDNLAGVRFSVSNLNLGGDAVYIFSIKDQDNRILRTLEAKESNLGWQYTFRYDFAPIENSSGKTYTLNLISAESTTSGNPLKVAYSEKDLYAGGFASLNGRPLSGDLLFSTYYQVSPAGFIADSWKDFQKRLAADKVFIFLYFFLFLVLFAVLLKRLTQQARP